ncbi:MAG TPA: hypothetical protein ENG96_03450 [Gammaproteobacteria bacterium]|nr:hypothetical protein [Gammaproteobacteria bacterium]
MANTGVTGRVVLAGGGALPGLKVVAYDREALAVDDKLGDTRTNSSGNFSISYGRWSYGAELEPDIVIKVFDSVHRLLYESGEFPDVSATIFAVPLISLDPDDVNGYQVTLLTGTPTLVSPANKLTMLIDNKTAWETLTNHVTSATSKIYTSQLYFDVEELFTVFSPPSPPMGSATTGTRLEEEILTANQARGVDVKIVMNDFIGAPYPGDTAGVVNDYFSAGSRSPNTVDIKNFRMPYNRAMHAKMTTIDNTVCVLNASPLLQEYFDDNTHLIGDPRRGTFSWPKNAIKVPVHDVSIKLEGAVMTDLVNTFSILWQRPGGTAIPAVVPTTPTGSGFSHSVQVTRTLPGNTFNTTTPAVPDGERGIFESYLRAISEATEVIYFENQYFTERKIASALLSRLLEHSSVQVIMLINNVVDIPRYQGMQTSLINQMISIAKRVGVNDRIGLFTLWSHEATPLQDFIRNYVHSKVGIVDGTWATVGSANLDGVSLNLSQHLIAGVSASDELEELAIELNVSIFNGVGGASSSTYPRDLKNELWAEHLGYPSPTDPALTSPPAGGWLALWKSRVAAKISGLSASTPTVHACRVLEWNEETDITRYLTRAGIPAASVTALNPRDFAPDFNFANGTWS